MSVLRVGCLSDRLTLVGRSIEIPWAETVCKEPKLSITCKIFGQNTLLADVKYRMARNIGGELYLAIWLSSVRLPNLKSPKYANKVG